MNVIEVKDVKKKFKIYYDKGESLKEKVLFKKRSRYDERWVLNGVSFDIKKGEAIGLIGENGCGKSTLLKLITKIIYPDFGSIVVNGRISSLLELGAGFHPDMSGRENIYTNASIFGLTKKEIDSRLDDIIEFSELGEFIDNPVRTYSSGMYMRLAFSVAINVNADILLIDEILAVGDASFQAKCFNKLLEIKRKGVTIVIVSHDMGSIERLCDKAVWLNKGVVRKIGNVRDLSFEYIDFIMNKNENLDKRLVIETDLEDNSEKTEEKTEEIADETVEDEVFEQDLTNEVLQEDDENLNNEEEIDLEIVEQPKRWGNKDIEITNIRLLNSEGNEFKNIKSGSDFKIEIDFVKNKPVEKFIMGIAINRIDGILIYGTNTKIDGIKFTHKKNKGKLVVNLKNVKLMQGEYFFDFAFEDLDSKPLDYYREAAFFNVYNRYSEAGLCGFEHQWVLDGEKFEF